jgi:hypothetical protein
VSADARRLAEEALRTRMFPGIAFRGEDWDRRPWVIGTAFDVWQIVDAHREVGSVEAMVVEGSLSELHVRLALVYHEWFPEQIDADIALNRRPLSQLRAEYPFIGVYSPAEA